MPTSSPSHTHSRPMTTYRVCFCFRRRFRPASSDPPDAIKWLFRMYSDGDGLMGPEQLRRFLVEVQGEEGATVEAAEGIIEGSREFRHLNVFYKRSGFSVDAFFRYLFSDSNPPTSPTLGIHHDMSAPLSHYFIYTGHNSYLTGNQLSSDCSDVPIIKALQRGVRVIELDMWPNSTKEEVHILHGRTLTTPVELIKCLTSIKEHAFAASPYPVIITIEDHLTPNLQAKVAEMVKQSFGEMLFVPDSLVLQEFPSPEDLKARLIISTKPPKEYLESRTVKDKDHDLPTGKDTTEEVEWGNEAQSDLDKGNNATEGEWGIEITDFIADITNENKNQDAKIKHLEDEENFDDRDHKSHDNIAAEYKRLIAIPARKKEAELSRSFNVDPNTVSRLSLSEQALEKALISYGTEIVRFTQRNLLRVYPRGTRITSSNYNPLVGWMHGAQMVAFNMQGYGRFLWLMHGMFRANGGCGYVKKPDILLQTDQYGQVFNPKVCLPYKKTLKVKVYMGDGWRFDFSRTHFDAYSPPDFYTRVGIAGVPADTAMKRTKVIEDDWTPVWDQEFLFPLSVPELALLRIEVHEYDMSEKDDFAGQTCLPVSELKLGIRAVPLFDRKGEKLRSVKLLMQFQFI